MTRFDSDQFARELERESTQLRTTVATLKESLATQAQLIAELRTALEGMVNAHTGPLHSELMNRARAALARSAHPIQAHNTSGKGVES